MIVVFGSLNIDLVTRVMKMPAPGETVLGPSYETIPGGKGANQALAAARAGANVRLVGAVGRDGFADVATRLLREASIDLAGVAAVDAPTGAAFITLDARGENIIVVASGANAKARAAQLDGIAWSPRDALLMQREVPAVEIADAALRARGGGARVILNAAPSARFDPALLLLTDILIVNEHEAHDVAAAMGWPAQSGEDFARRLASERDLLAIVTLGGDGAIGCFAGETARFAAPTVDVVDTVGAGDAFCGAFAAALDRGLDWRAAMRHAVAAGSLACGRLGAQPSLPFREEIERLAAAVA